MNTTTIDDRDIQITVDRKSYTIVISVSGNVLVQIPVEDVESFAAGLNAAVVEARSPHQQR